MYTSNLAAVVMPPAVLAAGLRAHHWPVTLALTLVGTVGALLAGGTTVDVPLASDPVPAWVLLAMYASIVVLTPLASAVPELEPTLSREPRLRVARPVCALVLAALIITPLWASVTGGPGRHVLVTFALLLLAAGIGAVVVIGELAWVIPLASGLVALIAEGGMAQPVSTILIHLPTPIAAAACLLTTGIYIWKGPRR